MIRVATILQLAVVPAGLSSPTIRLVLAGVLLTAALVLLLPAGRVVGWQRKLAGILAGVVGLCALWSVVPAFNSLTMHAGYWALATLTLAAAVATVTSINPVYSAIWFAVSLVGVAGLLLVNGSQFLAVATVAVYAGAIVVTFLFVLMLAQPSGHSFYDRIGWGLGPRLVGTATAVCFAVIVAASLAQIDSSKVALQDELRAELSRTLAAVPDLSSDAPEIVAVTLFDRSESGPLVRVVIRGDAEAKARLLNETQWARAALNEVLPAGTLVEVDLQFEDLLTPNHMAMFGGHLFGEHLFAVEAAGVLMLAALVGAIAIAARDSDRARGSRPAMQHEESR